MVAALASRELGRPVNLPRRGDRLRRGVEAAVLARGIQPGRLTLGTDIHSEWRADRACGVRPAA
jgi:hypothetical protein